LPGDIVIDRENVTLYIPLATCLVLSLVLSLIFWSPTGDGALNPGPSRVDD
jgi:hypothetical protein